MKTNYRRAGCAAIAIAMASAGTAAAQQAAPATASPSTQQDGTANTQAGAAGNDIIVTGSRIGRTDFDTPSPVLSLGSATIQQAGTTNLTDFLTGFASLQGSSTSADNSGDGTATGAAGLNLLNLRNLGTERTLVLVDGRRHVASLPGTQSVDVSTIPVDLIDRVEVLTGGASAVYGADAVTGVVNFILKRDFEGLTGRAQAGVTDRGDAGKRLFGVTAGKNFAGGRGNIALSYEYGEESRLDARARRYLQTSNLVGFFRNPADPEFKAGYTGGASNGIPDRVPTRNMRYNDTAREGAIDVNSDGAPDFIVDPGGRLVPFDIGTVVQPGFSTGGNATRLADYQNDLLPDLKRHVVNVLGQFEVSPALTLFAQGKYAHVKAFTLGQPTFDYALNIAPDNAYLPASLAGNGALLTRDNFDLGQRGQNVMRETFRTVVGARGALTPHARYEISYVFGQTNVTSDYVSDIYDDRFLAALDAVRDPATGQVTCRVNLDPTALPDQPNTDRYTGTPVTFKPGECVPLNLFGDNVASRAAIDFVRASTRDRSRIRQQVVSGSMSGDFGELFTLPGGPVGFALGAEYRKEESRFAPDAIAARGLTFTNALGRDEGSFDVKEAFGELNAPLVRDVPFLQRLEVGAAIRLSDYSTIGRTTAWKVDGTWSPIRDITFNGTYSKAVRAPNIGELFDARSQTFAQLRDPCDRAEIQNGTQYRAANCRTLLTGLGVTDPADYVDGRSATIPGFEGGNPALREEEATTWTAGVVFQPRFVPGLSIRADWYDIRLRDAINTVTSTEVARLCVDQPTLDNQFCPLLTRATVATRTAEIGNVTSFSVAPQNVARFATSGLDVKIAYRLDTASLGAFNLRVDGNYLNKLETFGTPGAVVTDQRGETAAPKYTVNTDVTWQKGKVTLNYGLTWFDKTSRYSNQVRNANPDIVAPEYLYLKALWQHDLFGSVDVNENFQFFAGMNNVFDQQPEIATSIYPVAAVGRYMFVGARVKM